MKVTKTWLQPDDDALPRAISPVLDSLYAGYASANG